MKKSFLIFGAIGLVAIGMILIGSRQGANMETVLTEAGTNMAMVYKSPTCGCCAIYVEYLDQLGFEVEVHESEDMSPIKEKYGISSAQESCHTTVIGDYFIEGHVPMEAIEKLLTEQPDIDGIGLPGMPSGTPGMPGAKMGTYEIYQLSDGEESVFLSL